jgi:peroxiredoxin
MRLLLSLVVCEDAIIDGMAEKPIVEKSNVDIVRLANCALSDSTGRIVKLGQLWQKQTIVFVFLRHFACIACRAHATQVWGDREKYEKSGAKIIFIGNGQPDFIDKFKEDVGIQNAVVFTDPELTSFRAAGFRRGFLAVVQPRTLLNVLQLASEGHRQTMPSAETGSNWQLGGILVVKPNGKIAYQYISEALGDFPPESDVDAMAETIE